MKEKCPREGNSGPEELGDISALYDNSVARESNPNLVKICTKHISASVEGLNLPKAQSLFDLMIKKQVEPNVYTYTILMKGYTRVGSTKKVYKLIEEMEENGVKPTIGAFNIVMEACAIDGDLEGALCFFDKMRDIYEMKPNVHTYNSTLKVCVPAKDLMTTVNLIEDMDFFNVKRDKVTMNTMIDVYAERCVEENGKSYLKECRKLIQDMNGKGIKADRQTYNTLVKLCSRGSLTAEAMKILAEMRSKGLHPDVVSYNTVLDGISKDQNLSKEEVTKLGVGIFDEMRKKAIRSNMHTYNSALNANLRLEDTYRRNFCGKQIGLFNVEATGFTYRTVIEGRERLDHLEVAKADLKSYFDSLEECE